MTVICVWGNLMESVVKIGIASVLLMSQAALGGVPLLSNDAFVSLSLSSQRMELPDAAPIGTYSGRTSLELFVASNNPYRVSIGFAGFVSKKGLAIGPNDTRLTINSVVVPVGRRFVPVWAANRTAGRGETIPLDVDFSVSNLNRYPAGAYSGDFGIAVEAVR